MQMNLKIFTALAVVSLFSIVYVIDNRSKILGSSKPTIQNWQKCIERIMLQTCDLDDPQDRDNCQNTANNTVQCYSETSPTAQLSCTHWWIFFESAKSSDILPDSFFQCSEECQTHAKENNFYFQKQFSPMWITCAEDDTSSY